MDDPVMSIHIVMVFTFLAWVVVSKLIEGQSFWLITLGFMNATQLVLKQQRNKKIDNC